MNTPGFLMYASLFFNIMNERVNLQPFVDKQGAMDHMYKQRSWKNIRPLKYWVRMLCDAI